MGASELKNRGLRLMDHGRIKESVAAFRNALKSAPRDPEIFDDLGVALRKGGDLAGSFSAPLYVWMAREHDVLPKVDTSEEV